MGVMIRSIMRLWSSAIRKGSDGKSKTHGENYGVTMDSHGSVSKIIVEYVR